jgi:putative peptidoglycan lipid II flippase
VPTPPSQDREAVGRPAAMVSAVTAGSRVGGLVRESLFAYLFGASHLADAFQVAFRIPNLLRDLFAEGALSSAFVPAFARASAERGEAAAWRLARVVLGTLLAVTGALAVLGILFAGPVVDVVAAGASADKRADAVPLARIMFPFLPIVAAAAVLMGVLNARRRYGPPAFAPVAFNLVAIVGGVVLALAGLSTRDALVGWSWLVLAAGLAQALVQWPAARREGWRGAPVVDLSFSDPALRSVVARMGPIALALAGTQVAIVISTALASEGDGWVSALTYAFRLIHLPIGLVGVALGTVSLAAASRRAAVGDSAGVDDVVRRGLRLNLFFALPASAGLLALAEPVVRVVYERGAFDARDTALVAAAVRAFAVGVAAYAGIKVAATAFHARGDTRTPMLASLAGIAVNLAVLLAGRGPFGFDAFAASTAAGALANYAVLRVVDRRLGRRAAPGTAFSAKVLLAAAAMGGAVLALGSTLLPRGGPFDHGTVTAALGVAVVVTIGACAYGFLAHVLRVEEASGIVDALRRRRRPGAPAA